jgi:ubiquinone/menaquinone biosynthesis C-methylase UbiE
VAKSLAERKFRGKAKILFIAADATRLPFKDLSADVIVAADFIEHIDDIGEKRFLNEAARPLSGNGRMIIFTPNKVREFIGTIVRWFEGGEGTRLHFGLTTRFSFEKKLKKRGFKYKRLFVDVVRPFLAAIPIVRELLALEILWVVKK